MSELSFDSGYYASPRPEVVGHVPRQAKDILDVGCGMGKLGYALKQQDRTRRVSGIELFEGAAGEARKVLDEVVTGDIQAIGFPFKPASFDCIIFADVLEHLLDPGSILRQARTVLRRDGCIVCSIPNMRHYTVILRLLLHGWYYDDFGLFDRTHLRFFSFATMRDLLESNGWHIVSVAPKIVASRKARAVNFLLANRLEEFIAHGYILRATLVTSS